MVNQTEIVSNNHINQSQIPPRSWGITGSTLKIIAIFAMFIDHFAAAIVFRLPIVKIYTFDEIQKLNDYYMILRAIGRFGFPIFAFLLVEGVTHTRNIKKYLRNMLIFCVVSEVPFDLAFWGKVIYPDYQNVFFTLSIGVAVLAVLQYAEKKQWQKTFRILPVLAMILVGPDLLYLSYKSEVIKEVLPYSMFSLEFWLLLVIAGGLSYLILLSFVKGMNQQQINAYSLGIIALSIGLLVAEGLKTDYASWGVFTIFIMYCFRKKAILSMVSGCTCLTLLTLFELPAFIMLFPISFYNGRRGIKSKYFFYIFYPAHLLLLALLAHFLGMIEFQFM